MSAYMRPEDRCRHGQTSAPNAVGAAACLRSEGFAEDLPLHAGLQAAVAPHRWFLPLRRSDDQAAWLDGLAWRGPASQT